MRNINWFCSNSTIWLVWLFWICSIFPAYESGQFSLKRIQGKPTEYFLVTGHGGQLLTRQQWRSVDHVRWGYWLLARGEHSGKVFLLDRRGRSLLVRWIVQFTVDATVYCQGPKEWVRLVQGSNGKRKLYLPRISNGESMDLTSDAWPLLPNENCCLDVCREKSCPPFVIWLSFNSELFVFILSLINIVLSKRNSCILRRQFSRTKRRSFLMFVLITCLIHLCWVTTLVRTEVKYSTTWAIELVKFVGLVEKNCVNMV